MRDKIESLIEEAGDVLAIIDAQEDTPRSMQKSAIRLQKIAKMIHECAMEIDYPDDTK